MSLIIEEINRSKRVLQRHRLINKTEVSIGRALDNDVILNEPHVSPHHMTLKKNDNDEWEIQDHDSLNGVRSTKRRKLASGDVVLSGDTLLLGRSYLRVWDEKHPVEETWPLHSIEDFFHRISHFGVVVGLMLLFVVGEWQFAQWQSYQSVPPTKIINELLYEMVIILGWSSLWSLSGRVTRHESRFLSHLAVSLIAAMLFQWLPSLIKVIAFNGLYGEWLREIRYFLNGAIFSVLLWCNFYLTLPQRSSARIIWSNTIAWGMVLIFLLPPIFDSGKFLGYPVYDRMVMSPSMLFNDPVTQQQFIDKAESLYGKQRNATSDAVNDEPRS